MYGRKAKSKEIQRCTLIYMCKSQLLVPGDKFVMHGICFANVDMSRAEQSNPSH